MENKNVLLQAYKQAKYQVTGHGKRDITVLKEALARVSEELESDMYGKGHVIEAFQEKMAAYLGKESAVFFPSGTMAQQIAMRNWCDRKGIKRVAYHPLCHLEIHEEDGLKELHHIESVLLADENRVIELDDVVNMKEEVSCLLLELPQREIGGQLPTYKTLQEISDYSRNKGIKLHLDGARLFEILPYYEKTAAEICSLFDSVYISFYKGIGGVAGAILAGTQDFTEESKVWKRRHGGDLISLYPYILSADYYFDQRIGKMEEYNSGAKELADLYNTCGAVCTLPIKPVSNMFHVHFHASKEQIESILAETINETGIGLTGHLRENGEEDCFFEVSIGDNYFNVPKDELKHAFVLLNKKLKERVLA
ncbi:threonine aldolase [Fictibacillus phosphorivorans]|uniref:Threonine aldolase n=1 Tax=Fictibacillus phosphorivorans TaxID=1221500 RepID=A0A165N6K5_9BACL|nr:beta-eliminating lyase-related protein [Fictibacillus phosphorivorans]KZE64817.1 threonine aldolase [Fictibacillus phosphorivorans]